MADLFILGAGFSKAISQEMPLVRDLSLAVRRKVPLETTVLSMGDDIELWLTHLSLSHPWLSEAENLRNRAQYLDLCQEIRETLEQCMQQALRGDCPTWLTNLVQWWHSNKATVLSLNYDTFVERAATTIEIEPSEERASRCLNCEDIYPIPLTPAAARVGAVLTDRRLDSLQLFKLHGSVNWFYSGSTLPGFYGETIYYVPLRGWKLGAPIEETHGAYAFDKVPMIVPPALDKTAYFHHETIRNLWSRAGYALRQAERIFCLGYSLPETDVSMRMFLLTNPPKERVEFYIVNIDPHTQEHFHRLLVSGPYDLKSPDLGSDPIPSVAQLLVGQ